MFAPIMMLLNRLRVDKLGLWLILGLVWGSLLLKIQAIWMVLITIVVAVADLVSIHEIIVTVDWGLLLRVQVIKAYSWLLWDCIIPRLHQLAKAHLTLVYIGHIVLSISCILSSHVPLLLFDNQRIQVLHYIIKIVLVVVMGASCEEIVKFLLHTHHLAIVL